jgi:predicted outer membrane repeat protein
MDSYAHRGMSSDLTATRRPDRSAWSTFFVAVVLAFTLHRTSLAQSGPVTVTPICDVGWLLEWEPVDGAIDYWLVKPGWCAFGFPLKSQQLFVGPETSVVVDLLGFETIENAYLWAQVGPGSGFDDFILISSSVQLVPQQSVLLKKSLAPITRFDPAEPVEFSVAAYQPDLEYEWRVNGASVTPASPTKLVLPANTLQAGDSIQCRVTNSCGTVISQTVVIPDEAPAEGLARWTRVVRRFTGDPDNWIAWLECCGCNCLWPINWTTPYWYFTSERSSWSSSPEGSPALASEATGRFLTLSVVSADLIGLSLDAAATIDDAGASVVVNIPPSIGTGSISISVDGSPVFAASFGPTVSVASEFIVPSGDIVVSVSASPLMYQANACGLMAPSPVSLSLTVEFRSLADCNGNGVADWIDIASGVLTDEGDDGLPDSCGPLLVPGQFPTIAAAVVAANDGDTIIVAPGTYAERIALAGKKVSIVAEVDGTVVLDGGGLPGTILAISGGQGPETVVRGIVFRDSSGGSPLPTNPDVLVGGALLVFQASPRIEACRFENNAAGYGGAVYAIQSQSVFEDCIFEDNSAGFDGGALQALNAPIDVVRCEFVGNSAASYGGAIHAPLGVAIGDQRVDLVDCTLVGNSALNGGALSFHSTSAALRLRVVGSTIGKNEASSGGAIFSTPGVAAIVEIGETEICANAAPQLATVGWVDLGGNSICPDGPVTLTVPGRFPTIAAAIAAANDGDTILVAPGTYPERIGLAGKKVSIVAEVEGTVVLDGGGLPGTILAISGGQGPETVFRGIVFRDSASGSPLPTNPNILVGGALLVFQASPRIEACRFENNAAGYGGAVYAIQSESVFEDCVFAGNSAGFDGGALQALNAPIDVIRCEFVGNSAAYYGGAIHAPLGVAMGDARVDLIDCTLTGNSAEFGGAVSFHSISSSRRLRVTGSAITANDAGLAGAIYATPGVASIVEIGESEICGNSIPQLAALAWVDLGGNAECPCPGDLNGDRAVTAADISILLGFWGPELPTFPAADLTGDGFVDAADLSVLLGGWGACETLR